MENEARYILVGSVIVAISLALLASLVWLAGGERIAYQHYTVYFSKESLDGLDPSSPVKIRGIKVGEVMDYAFVPGNREAVRVNIKIEPGTPIHADSHATVQRNIVTGLASIEIDNPHSDSPLMPGRATPPWPVIAEGSSDLERVTTNLTQMSDKTAELIDNLNQVLDQRNRDALAHTLDNLQQVSAQLARHSRELDDTLGSFRAAADSLTHMADDVGVTSDETRSDLKLLTHQTSHTLVQAGQALDTLQQQSVILSRELQRLTDTADYRLNQIGGDVHQGETALTGTSRRLSNPGSLIFGTGRDETAPGE